MHDFFMAVLCKSVGGELIFDSSSTLRYRQHGRNVVGIGKTKLGNIANFVKNITSNKKTKIDMQADTIYKTYSKYIQSDCRAWLEFIALYNKNYLYRLKLACSRKTIYKNLHMSLKTRLEILCGNR